MNDGLSAPPTRRFLGSLVLLGLLWRVVVDLCTPMPREDGVNYLWMAERFAHGEVAQGLGEVFSPLLAMVIAVPVALGMDPFRGGQLVLALIGALVVVPVAQLSEALRAGTGRSAAVLAFVAAQPVVLGAQIYTEPLFLLLAGGAFAMGVRERFTACGVLSAAAFWVRPEAAVIPVVFLLGSRHPRRLLAFPWLLAAIAGLATWRGLCGHGFDPVPKLAFIMAHNVAAEQGALERLALLPNAFLLAFWPMAVLAVIGVFRWRPPVVLWMLLFACLIIWAYVPRRRFFVNWMFAVAPLAAAAVVRLPRRQWWLAAVVAIELALAFTGGSTADRIVERQVAEHLRALLRPGEVIAGDMTRVLYFAGSRPLEPRHYTADQLVAAGRDARFVVLRGRRDYAGEVRRRLPEHREWSIPPELRADAESRGLIVLERR